MTSAENLPLRSLLDVAPDGFVVADSAGRIIWANQTAHVLFGYGNGDLIDLSIEDLVPERLRLAHSGHRGGYQKAPHGRPMGLGLDLLGVKKDGTEFPVEISLSPLNVRDGLLVTAVVRDVTERKQLEEERNSLTLEVETNRERDRIAMDLHDGIMQDVYAVALGLELSLAVAQEGMTGVDGIEKAIVQLNQIIRGIRSFIFDLRPREFSGSLSDALANLADEFAQNSQIATQSNVERGEEPKPGTSMTVYLIAHEALSNVRKHARANRVLVSLSFSDGAGHLAIRDDGTGFDPSVKPPPGHYGIHNMMTRARSIGATLEVESAPGKGTSLRLSFPTA
jgi:PAS domain S-box-containing protein